MHPIIWTLSLTPDPYFRFCSLSSRPTITDDDTKLNISIHSEFFVETLKGTQKRETATLHETSADIDVTHVTLLRTAEASDICLSHALCYIEPGTESSV